MFILTDNHRNEFREWLKANGSFINCAGSRRCANCPIARFLNYKDAEREYWTDGYKYGICDGNGEYIESISGSTLPLPDWAKDVVVYADNHYDYSYNFLARAVSHA
jgi:hypothetical protein